MDDRLMFESTLQHNAARLSAVAARFTRGMPEHDQNCLIGDAINLMWMRRHEFDPKKRDIGQFAAECLRDAARLQKKWRVWRAGEWQWVKSKHLEEWR